MRMKKVNGSGSTSVIKTLEYLLRNKWTEITSLDDQARVITSLFSMAKMKQVSNEPQSNKQFISNALEMADNFIFDLSELRGDRKVKIGNAIQVYYHLVCEI
jgi:hypothetical protein